MNKRISLISLLGTEDLGKIQSMVGLLGEAACKVPFISGVENRLAVDTLPFHFTVYTWGRGLLPQVVEALRAIGFPEITVKVDGVGIMDGAQSSHVLYLSIGENPQLRQLQKILYDQSPNEKYRPDRFVFHITLHVDKDFDKIAKMKQRLEHDFRPFDIKVSDFGLFEIYPAKMIARM
jgi:2'-5' RNA ligase